MHGEIFSINCELYFDCFFEISFVGFGAEILDNYSHISRLTYDDVHFSSIYAVWQLVLSYLSFDIVMMYLS